MHVYTYSEARQKLTEVLNLAERQGKALIRRKDGKIFALVPEKRTTSPLDVPSVEAELDTDELVALIRAGRERETLS